MSMVRTATRIVLQLRHVRMEEEIYKIRTGVSPNKSTYARLCATATTQSKHWGRNRSDEFKFETVMALKPRVRRSPKSRLGKLQII